VGHFTGDDLDVAKIKDKSDQAVARDGFDHLRVFDHIPRDLWFRWMEGNSSRTA